MVDQEVEDEHNGPDTKISARKTGVKKLQAAVKKISRAFPTSPKERTESVRVRLGHERYLSEVSQGFQEVKGVQRPIKTFTAEEIKAARLDWDNTDGVLRNSDREIASTMGTTSKQTPNTLAFVMDKEGRLYVAHHTGFFAAAGDETTTHGSILDRVPAEMAGLITIENGKITRLKNDSGHYAPQDIDMYRGISILQKKHPGIFHENATIEIDRAGEKFDWSITGFIALHKRSYAHEINQREFDNLQSDLKRQMPITGYKGPKLHSVILSNATDKETVEQIERFKEDINVQDKFGNTPLHYAAMQYNANPTKQGMQTITSLLDHGAKTDVLNNYRSAVLDTSIINVRGREAKLSGIASDGLKQAIIAHKSPPPPALVSPPRTKTIDLAGLIDLGKHPSYPPPPPPVKPTSQGVVAATAFVDSQQSSMSKSYPNPEDIRCYDIDRTAFKGHMHSLLSKTVGLDKNLENKTVVYDHSSEPISGDKRLKGLATAQDKMEFNYEVMSQIAMDIVEGKKVAMTSFTHFPDIAYKLLTDRLKKEPYKITDAQLESSFKVVGGYPLNGPDDPSRKTQHIFRAQLAYGIPEDKISLEGARLYDDDPKNILKAWSCGMKTSWVNDGAVESHTIPLEVNGITHKVQRDFGGSITIPENFTAADCAEFTAQTGLAAKAGQTVAPPSVPQLDAAKAAAMASSDKDKQQKTNAFNAARIAFSKSGLNPLQEKKVTNALQEIFLSVDLDKLKPQKQEELINHAAAELKNHTTLASTLRAKNKKISITKLKNEVASSIKAQYTLLKTPIINSILSRSKLKLNATQKAKVIEVVGDLNIKLDSAKDLEPFVKIAAEKIHGATSFASKFTTSDRLDKKKLESVSKELSAEYAILTKNKEQKKALARLPTDDEKKWQDLIQEMLTNAAPSKKRDGSVSALRPTQTALDTPVIAIAPSRPIVPPRKKDQAINVADPVPAPRISSATPVPSPRKILPPSPVSKIIRDLNAPTASSSVTVKPAPAPTQRLEQNNAQPIQLLTKKVPPPVIPRKKPSIPSREHVPAALPSNAQDVLIQVTKTLQSVEKRPKMKNKRHVFKSEQGRT